MGKQVFVLDGHPVRGSFVHSLCIAYSKGAEQAGHEVRQMSVADMKFDPDLDHGYDQEKTLEPSLLEFQENLKWCNHFVLGYPLWWGTVPAKTKGLIDRAFLPEFAFSYDKESNKVTRLLTGKTALVMVTSDTPNWYFNLAYRASGFHMMKTQIFEFCGIRPVKFKHISTIMDSDADKRKRWIAQAERNGRAL